MTRVRLPMLRSLLAAGVLLLSAAPPASAGSLNVDTQREDQGDGESVVTYAVSYIAAPGERNDVTLTHSGGAWVLGDSGAAGAIKAVAPCRTVDTHTVSCADPDLAFTAIDVGDGDDRATVAAGPTVNGGPGDDVVTGSKGDDTLVGGTGDDTVNGGDGDDTLLGDGGAPSAPNGRDTINGGPGADTLIGDGGAVDALLGTDRQPSAPDQLDGGPGGDVVSYAAESLPMSIDLAARTATGPAIGDVLVNLEGVVGGQGDDTISGTDGPELLLAGAGGADTIDGRRGADQIDGGPGRDRLRGSAGNDVINGDAGADHEDGGDGNDIVDAADDTFARFPIDVPGGAVSAIGNPISATSEPKRVVDDIACGAGADLVRRPDARQGIPPGCEGVQVQQKELVLASGVTVRGGRARVTASCPGPYGCGARVELLDRRGRVLASAEVLAHKGVPVTRTLRTTRRGRATLRHPPSSLVLRTEPTLINDKVTSTWTAPVKR